MSSSLMWFRRDLRLSDHPALCRAAGSGEVLPVFVLDPTLIRSGGPRSTRLMASLAALQEDLGGALVVRSGDPVDVIPEMAAEVDAGQVHISAETTPYGRRRDEAVARRLSDADIRLVATGSAYAVTPGRVSTGSGAPYRVFTPFRRAWEQHGWGAPAARPEVRWLTDVAGEQLDLPDSEPAGEREALRRWDEFCATDLVAYDEMRNRPDEDRTSRMSVPLKYGEVHPRTLLADLLAHPARHDRTGIERFETELAWREFYADVLWHHPRSAWHDWKDDLADMRYDADPARIEAWRLGRTGYPFVDAGMRQLLSQGWMHNRVRMVTASFLVKDLHVWWTLGARHFMDHLADGDVASNSHGWQWVAGTGTDASPYFRIFNPVAQGLRFDPSGDYVRRWIPELRHLAGAAAHEPWHADDGYREGYPARMVDHDEERRESLARWEEVRSTRR
ncbi:MAG TPA: deoxyribodipyrimidine photo-lyase [Aeromicrobium sp.]|nr:deoxyribodipyrimidine photo-lyase [Aeromicrobium sp.]